LWNKKGFTAELKDILLWVIIIAFVIGLFFVLKNVLSANADGVSNTIFQGLGFR